MSAARAAALLFLAPASAFKYTFNYALTDAVQSVMQLTEVRTRRARARSRW
jgi:hypothetical protein